MAIIDQRVINSYSNGDKEAEYKDGDLAVRFPQCPAAGVEACEAETESFVQAWRRAFADS
jgi:mannan polymerase II complex MNN11 subunit